MRNLIKKILNESLKETKDYFGSKDDIRLKGHLDYTGKVFVHRNLNKPPYWTIKLVNGNVIGYDKVVHLNNVIFSVADKGRERVLKSKQKNVHAGIIGNVVQNGSVDITEWIPVTYNPYKNTTFVRVDNGNPIFTAKEAILMNAKEVWVKL